MNKTLSKEIINRARLRNKFLKDRPDYSKKSIQDKVLCVFCQKAKKYQKDKIVSKEKITLIEKDKIVESNINTVQILNTFFLNAISNLKIAE